VGVTTRGDLDHRFRWNLELDLRLTVVWGRRRHIDDGKIIGCATSLRAASNRKNGNNDDPFHNFTRSNNLYLYGPYNHPSLRVNTPLARRQNLYQVFCTPWLTPRFRSAQPVLNRRPVQYIAPPCGEAIRPVGSVLGAGTRRIGFSSVLPAAPGMSLWQPRMMPASAAALFQARLVAVPGLAETIRGATDSPATGVENMGVDHRRLHVVMPE
jgi:hypothetical protein